MLDWRGMGEVTLELIYRQMQAGHDELKAELAAVREEQARTNAAFAAMARTLVNVQRDIRIVQRELSDLKDRVTVLTVASADNDQPHV